MTDSADQATRRVIKLGGSLLRQTDLVERLERWLERTSDDQTLMIVGGGRLIDAIRELDAIRPGDQAETHWRCVRLLQTTFEIVRDWFPHWHAIETADAFEIAKRSGFDPGTPTLVSVPAFYREGNTTCLPDDWRTTTDAIAAWLAMLVSADELVLLKSCDVDTAATVEELSRHGIVDEALPSVADRIPRVSVERLK